MANLRDRLALYVLTDERDDRDSLLEVCEAALRGGAGVIQLRRKRESGRRLMELGWALRKLTTAYHALYIVNDRVDVALATDADGVHLGQDDMPLSEARRLMGQAIIGISARTIAEAQQAVDEGADYLGVGAIFATRSKLDAEISGLAGLRAIAAAIRECPLVAIGGIGEANAQRVLDAGAHGLAVVSAVMAAADPEEAARLLLQRVATGRRR
jgi:thiamine-phosphate pyrophosphorylase